MDNPRAPWYCVDPMAKGRRDDETALTSVTILRSDNARMKRMCEQSLQRMTVLHLAQMLIHYGVENIDAVQAWYGLDAKKTGAPQPGDESSPD